MFHEINRWSVENNPYLKSGTQVRLYDNIFHWFIDEIEEKYGRRIQVLRKYLDYLFKLPYLLY